MFRSQYVDGAIWVAQYEKGRAVSEIEGVSAKHGSRESGVDGGRGASFYAYSIWKSISLANCGAESPQSRAQGTHGRQPNAREAYSALGVMGDIEFPTPVQIRHTADQKMDDALNRRMSTDPYPA